MFHSNLNKLFTFGFSILMMLFLSYSVSISYKKEVVDDHVEFLIDQIPRLKAENEIAFNQLLKYKDRLVSIKKRIDKFIPFLEYLSEEKNVYSIEDLETINTYLVNHLESSDLLMKRNYNRMSENIQHKLSEYLYVQFQNDLIQTLFMEMGTFSPGTIENQFTLVDFWTKHNYEIHLDFHPKNSFETPMKINGKLYNKNTLLFEPSKEGLHTFDISFLHIDNSGAKKEFYFTKEIFVLP